MSLGFKFEGKSEAKIANSFPKRRKILVTLTREISFRLFQFKISLTKSTIRLIKFPIRFHQWPGCQTKQFNVKAIRHPIAVLTFASSTATLLENSHFVRRHTVSQPAETFRHKKGKMLKRRNNKQRSLFPVARLIEKWWDAGGIAQLKFVIESSDGKTSSRLVSR